MVSSAFRLKIQRVDQHCLFELSWGQGQQMSATVAYPAVLMERYQAWQRIYLRFYSSAITKATAPSSNSSPPLRGWNMASGVMAPENVDWHAKLLEAETLFLQEFHRWLRSAELFDIRAAIARSSHQTAPSHPTHQQPGVTIFLTCAPMELSRFPWEAWEIGGDFITTGSIRIVRSPQTIAQDTATLRPRRRARVLAIFGDDTGLNFQDDSEAIQSLSSVADVTFVGWQPGQTVVEVKEQICQAIADKRGWDILFFAGHSNETVSTGGELAVAPNMSMTIQDISAHLSRARQLGLQVAIFNSCKGLNIASSLINLGFSQVVVMREPVHNRVAQEFLVQFLRQLGDYKDIHESMLAACQVLRFEKNLTYPSAYLLPSLFCHPGAELFRLNRWDWTQQLGKWIPTRLEAIALTACATLSLLPGVQDGLLNGRTAVQAVYRDFTHQIQAPSAPPVALIQIDTESISRDGVTQVHPIDRQYLARLVQRLNQLGAPLVGLDVILDTPQPGDDLLGAVVQQAVARDQMWVLFAAILDINGELGVSDATQIASLDWSLQGYIDADPYYVMLPLIGDDCRYACPFAYLLALAHMAHQELSPSTLPMLNLNSVEQVATATNSRDLRTRLLATLQPQIAQHQTLSDLWQARLPILSYWAYEWGRQHWLEPIIDFSIPPSQVYTRIPAWQLLEPTHASTLDLSQQIVLVAAGHDDRTAISPGSPDRFPAPLALRYWQRQHWLTGGESLAYMTQHLLSHRLVVPIPDLWMVSLAAVLAKATVLWLQARRFTQDTTFFRYPLRVLAIATVAASIISLQLFITAELLVPVLLPATLFWAYTLSNLSTLRSSND
ncbi:MAG: CHASE2 domain-containing protein [Merismopedia sp. SIO2A8]|nr:CHASE2 domain-containing protein [Symploca sp. SIO2B6]NET48241.1 CHASE2 domain-containing protein [Merismopedia sp. SIO2A8]